jgi:hypothetical protein
MVFTVLIFSKRIFSMFKSNTAHLQDDLFSSITLLPPEKQKKLRESKQWYFYDLIFCQIDESLFECLYSEKGSRPNAPVNTMVASLILKHQFGWTFQELFDHIDFDLLTRSALGLRCFDSTPFAPSTLFDFQRRLFEHEVLTGENLFETVFDRLTAAQLTRLKLKTSIQRTDSVLIASNIRDYSRLHLLIEVLLRFYRVLADEDKTILHDLLAPYLSQSASKYLYRLTREALPHELTTLGAIYYQVHQHCHPTYSEVEMFTIFHRVYTEHFTVVDETVTVIPGTELSGTILQSPDDPDATYRKKRDDASTGYVLNTVETAHPENPLNLVVDVVVAPNTTDDSVLLNERIDHLKEKTPALNELHTDGGYGSEDNDKKLAEAGIEQIQTAVKGRKAAVEFTIIATGDQTWQVSCPHQTTSSEPTPTRFKACFDKATCATCPFAEVCPTVEQKAARTLFFTSEDAARNARHRRIQELPSDRQTLRSNVEATIREFVSQLHDHTVSVRGLFKTALFAFNRAIAINFGRIFRSHRLELGESSR